MKWNKVIANKSPLPETACIVLANKGSVFTMYYGLDNTGRYSWYYNNDPVRPYMIPTHYITTEELQSLEKE